MGSLGSRQLADQLEAIKVTVDAALYAGFEGDDLIDAVAIAGAESRWRTDAENPRSSATGLWQIAYDVWKDSLVAVGILPERNKRRLLHEPHTNAMAAMFITQQGLARQHGKWSDWAVHPDSKSRGFYTPNNDYSQYLEVSHEVILEVLGIGKSLNIAEGSSGLPRYVRVENGETITSDEMNR